MAHELNTTNGTVSFFEYSESLVRKAWHGLGKVVSQAPNSEEALKLANLDWTIKQYPLKGMQLIETPEGPIQEYWHTDSIGNFRSDTMQHLGTVSSRYCPVNNRQAFEFLDNLNKDGIIRYETAGVLGKGERVFMLAQLPGHTKIADSEEVPFMFVFNSHDGTSGLECIPTSVRVVCANTVRIARGTTRKITFRHTASITQKMEMATRLHEYGMQSWAEWCKTANRLVAEHMTLNEFIDLLGVVLPRPKKESSETSHARWLETHNCLIRLYQDDPTQQNIKGTKWGALNAFTLHQKYGRHILKGNVNESRFLRTMEGAGNDMTQHALQLLTA